MTRPPCNGSCGMSYVCRCKHNAITEITIDSHDRTVTLWDDTGTPLDDACADVYAAARRMLWAWTDAVWPEIPAHESNHATMMHGELDESATCALVLHGSTIAGPL